MHCVVDRFNKTYRHTFRNEGELYINMYAGYWNHAHGLSNVHAPLWIACATLRDPPRFTKIRIFAAARDWPLYSWLHRESSREGEWASYYLSCRCREHCVRMYSALASKFMNTIQFMLSQNKLKKSVCGVGRCAICSLLHRPITKYSIAPFSTVLVRTNAQ